VPGRWHKIARGQRLLRMLREKKSEDGVKHRKKSKRETRDADCVALRLERGGRWDWGGTQRVCKGRKTLGGTSRKQKN